MQRKRVFISSVKAEFATERQLLCDYLASDALLSKFFEPFIFENTPALNSKPSKIFLKEVENCDIYLGIFGKDYGFEDAKGVSPTEREYDLATKLHKTRLVYIKRVAKRDKKEAALIDKIEKNIIRKSFSDADELKTDVYASLIRYLEEREFIRISPFDATLHRTATLEDIDERKVKDFIARAKAKRNFPFDEKHNYKMVLAHLGLIVGKRVTNAAILLFGKQPQKFFITSSVKCCQFYGNKVEKPIPSYHIYDGDVFELIDQAVSFVMSRIDAKVSGRDKSILADVESELPLQAVTEAIVNAVCHRDYTNNASVQVMLFKNRLEIWNPGQLPYGLTTEMLKTHHNSQPANPLLARPMYLYGSIEQAGTGTEMIVEKCIEHDLQAPVFQQDEIFKLTMWRRLNVEESGKTVEENEKSREESGKSREENEKSREESGKSREKGAEKIFQLISANPKITQKELAKLTGLSRQGVEKNIAILKTRCLIQRAGANKGGYWILKEVP